MKIFAGAVLVTVAVAACTPTAENSTVPAEQSSPPVTQNAPTPDRSGFRTQTINFPTEGPVEVAEGMMATLQAADPNFNMREWTVTAVPASAAVISGVPVRPATATASGIVELPTITATGLADTFRIQIVQEETSVTHNIQIRVGVKA